MSLKQEQDDRQGPSPSERSRLRAVFANHPRHWQDNDSVYPVISRRSGGLSVGINLNPDKACNFNCVYCQVDRTVAPAVRKVDVDVLRDELEHIIQGIVSGGLFEDPLFGHVPERFRRFNDIAFSGDGEPTTSPQFPDAVRIAADLRRKYHLDPVKLILITDAVYLTKPRVRETLAMMDANNGEIWAKLDAGTEEYFQLINRPNVSLQVVLENILDAARVRPIVIQSLWMNVNDTPPPDTEIDAFAQRLRWIIDNGGLIRLLQVYTIARQTAEPFVSPLGDRVLRRIAQRVGSIVSLPTEVYGS